jgi:hypothetical protein
VECTSTLLRAHAIYGNVSAPTAEHRRQLNGFWLHQPALHFESQT